MSEQGDSVTRRGVLGGGAGLALAGVVGVESRVADAASTARAVAGAAPIEPWILPELRAAAAEIRQMMRSNAPLGAATLAERRAAMGRWQQPLRAGVPHERREIPGPDGTALTVHVVNARAGASRPAILHTHGGGFVLGTAALDVPDLQDLARELDCVCVTVEYRLAPEVRWQGSVADNHAGLKWLHDHAGELGADRARIALLGDSAGGGHAALLAIEARERGEVPLVAQVLVYPMLDDRTGSSRAVAAHIGSLAWTAADNRYGWRSFLGVEPGGPDVPSAAVPARVANLAGLPPTFIGVGSIDLFVEEDVEYARRLLVAGVPVELLVVPGAYHAFDRVGAATTPARQFNAAKLEALRRAFTQ